MHGAGNDFIVIDARGLERDWPSLAVSMCDRYFGAGADGILLALPSTSEDIRMVVYNADGSEAEMCGNGIRCFAKYVIEQGMTDVKGDTLRIETIAGTLIVDLIREGDKVVGATADMGPPRFEPRDLPVAVERAAPILDLDVPVDGKDYDVACVSMGNPHAVHFIESKVGDFPLRDVGPKVEHHVLFPARVNFEVAQVLDRGHIESRTWERGVGETNACGTGACAIMVSAKLRGFVDDVVEVKEPGGVLTIRWDGKGSAFLSGPAAFVYEGDWPD